MTELVWTDACAQAELVRSGGASPRELVDAAIERIEGANPQINAVIHPRFERARAEASGPLPDGPFRGVPLLLKDLDAQSAGDPWHCGMAVARTLQWTSDHDSALVTRFRRAGFVIVGRTNVPELGTAITTEPVAYGPTHNPWNLERSSGGSSGGSAAAVAAGLTPVAHAADGGGSIRVPASECGIVGLKPTRARVSMAPDHGELWMGAVVSGVVTRTVRDTAACLDVIAGPEPGDPYPAPPLPRPLREEVGAPSGPLRVGLLDRPALPGIAADAECSAAVGAAGRLLEQLGHKVEAAHPAVLADDELIVHFTTLVSVATATDVDSWSRRIGRTIGDHELEASNALLAAMGRSTSAPDYLASVEWLHGYQRRMAGWWAADGFDLLVTPVLNGTPPPIGWLTDPDHGMERTIGMLPYLSPFNITGQPALSLPLHWSADGLPVGVQFVAAFGHEGLLIRLASQLEQACPWAGRHPPVHG